jgi:hypothetical protein
MNMLLIKLDQAPGSVYTNTNIHYIELDQYSPIHTFVPHTKNVDLSNIFILNIVYVQCTGF